MVSLGSYYRYYGDSKSPMELTIAICTNVALFNLMILIVFREFHNINTVIAMHE